MNTLVLEETEDGEVTVDVYQKLANDGIIFITDILTDALAADIVASLLLRGSDDSTEEITLFINSQGGDIRNAFMIYDVMQMISCPINTVCIGAAMDEAVILLAGGTPGLRQATPHAMISANQLVHDYHAHVNVTDASKILKQSKIDNDRLLKILAASTGKDSRQIRLDFDRRVFFNAKQAVKYGLIDKVVKFNK